MLCPEVLFVAHGSYSEQGNCRHQTSPLSSAISCWVSLSICLCGALWWVTELDTLFVSPLPVWANMMSSIKLEVHNLLQCRHGGSSHGYEQCAQKIWWKFDMGFLRYACRQTCRQTHIQTCSSPYFATILGTVTENGKWHRHSYSFNWPFFLMPNQQYWTTDGVLLLCCNDCSYELFSRSFWVIRFSLGPPPFFSRGEHLTLEEMGFLVH